MINYQELNKAYMAKFMSNLFGYIELLEQGKILKKESYSFLLLSNSADKIENREKFLEEYCSLDKFLKLLNIKEKVTKLIENTLNNNVSYVIFNKSNLDFDLLVDKESKLTHIENGVYKFAIKQNNTWIKEDNPESFSLVLENNLSEEKSVLCVLSQFEKWLNNYIETFNLEYSFRVMLIKNNIEYNLI